MAHEVQDKAVEPILTKKKKSRTAMRQRKRNCKLMEWSPANKLCEICNSPKIHILVMLLTTNESESLGNSKEI